MSAPSAPRLSLLWASTFLALQAMAQTPSAPASDPDTEMSGRKGEIKQVVVTAERRRATAQRTSIALTAVSGDEARTKGQTTLRDVILDTPALNIQTTPQGGQVYIRGIGSSGDSNWVDPAVGLMIDGVYSGRAEAVMSSLYDVSRIEVLRGPQGTLYGRNSTGGTINVIASEPEKHFGSSVNTQVGSHGLRHVDGMINLPLNDVVQARLAVLREKRDGYFSNNGAASDLTGARFKLKATPSAGVALGLTLDHYRQAGDGATTVPRQGTNLPPFANWPRYPADSQDPWWVDDAHPADKQDIRFTTVSAQADVNLGFASLTLIPAWVESERVVTSDLVAGTALGPIGTSTWTEKQKSLEVRLSSPAAQAARWVAGAYFFSSDNRQVGRLGSPLSYDVYGQAVPTRSSALFGQVVQPLTESLRIIAGARYTTDKRTQTFGIQAKDGSYDSGLQSVGTDGSAVTWKLGLEHDLGPQNMVYLSASTGYKAGGFSTSAVPPVAYKPEHLLALELGSKNRFLGNTLQLNAALYAYRYRNHQLQYVNFEPSPNPNDASGTTQFALWIANARTASNYGAEGELKWQLTTADQVKAALSYIDAHYGGFDQPALQSLAGTRMANTARWSGSLGYERVTELASGASLTSGIGVRLTQGYRITPDLSIENAEQPGYGTVDASISWRSADGRWNVGAWGRNLSNRAVSTYALPLGRVMLGAPRTVGINASVNF